MKLTTIVLFLSAALGLFAQTPANLFNEPDEVSAKAFRDTKELNPRELRGKFDELEQQSQQQRKQFLEEFSILKRVAHDSKDAKGYNRNHYLWMSLLYHQERLVAEANFHLSMTELSIASILEAKAEERVNNIREKMDKGEAGIQELFKAIDQPDAGLKHTEYKPPADEEKVENLVRARLAAWAKLSNSKNPVKN